MATFMVRADVATIDADRRPPSPQAPTPSTETMPDADR